jgi:hypothetical protein
MNLVDPIYANHGCHIGLNVKNAEGLQSSLMIGLVRKAEKRFHLISKAACRTAVTNQPSYLVGVARRRLPFIINLFQKMESISQSRRLLTLMAKVSC